MLKLIISSHGCYDALQNYNKHLDAPSNFHYLDHMNIHQGQLIADSPLRNIERLSLEDIQDAHLDAFLIGYYDRTCEALDNKSYIRVENIKTVLELFYRAGYILAHHDIALGSIHKDVNQMNEFREIARNYLYRFNVKNFYEKNSQSG